MSLFRVEEVDVLAQEEPRQRLGEDRHLGRRAGGCEDRRPEEWLSMRLLQVAHQHRNLRCRCVGWLEVLRFCDDGAQVLHPFLTLRPHDAISSSRVVLDDDGLQAGDGDLEERRSGRRAQVWRGREQLHQILDATPDKHRGN